MSSILSLEYSEHELKFALDNKLHGNFKTALRFFDAKLNPPPSSPPSLSSASSHLFPDESDPSIREHLLNFLEAEKESCLVHLSQWDRLKTPPFTSTRRQDLIYSFTEEFSNRTKGEILHQKLMELWRKEEGREGEGRRREEKEEVWEEFYGELSVNWLMGEREDVEKAKFFLAMDKRKLLMKFSSYLS
jgi:hypothetical protein